MKRWLREEDTEVRHGQGNKSLMIFDIQNGKQSEMKSVEEANQSAMQQQAGQSAQ